MVNLFKEDAEAPFHLQRFSSLASHTWVSKNLSRSYPSSEVRNSAVKWSDWIDRLLSRYGDHWKMARIYDSIILSKQSVNRDENLLATALCFWNSASNTPPPSPTRSKRLRKSAVVESEEIEEPSAVPTETSGTDEVLREAFEAVEQENEAEHSAAVPEPEMPIHSVPGSSTTAFFADPVLAKLSPNQDVFNLHNRYEDLKPSFNASEFCKATHEANLADYKKQKAKLDVLVGDYKETKFTADKLEKHIEELQKQLARLRER
ncbi:unnamed protein product [Prunus brigantina]